VGDLTGRIMVVTGASSGIGLAAATALARRGATLALVGRDVPRLDAATEAVREAGGRTPYAYRADFNRLEDVHVLADHLRQRFDRIDVLANNAGGVVRRRDALTEDGFEATIQTNHLAAFLLSNLLREQLRGGRIVNTSSAAHAVGRLNPDDLRGTRRGGLWSSYGAAKQANVLFTVEATKRWPDIFSAAYHPGFVRSRFGSTIGLTALTRWAPIGRTPQQGADTLVFLAATPRTQLTPGAYYLDRKPRTAAPHATDPTKASRLWDASLAAVGLT
jgi:daunorubicin C-13 ketoreductase